MNRLICASCHKTYGLDEVRWGCDCGGVLDIEFDGGLDPAAVASGAPDIWRYREALALPARAGAVTLGEGFTPLREMRLAGKKVLVKEEYLNPTGSFKDRGAAVLVSKVRQLGVKEVVEDSSGNAGAAAAAYCREAGIKCTVFVPEKALRDKVERITSFGAKVIRVKGGRQDCARAALKAAGRTYYASHARNPFFLEGTRTLAYEVCEQLGWRAPDAVVLPVGNGTLLLGAYAGFAHLVSLGLAGSLPRLIGVQAKTCAPLFHAFHGTRAADGMGALVTPGRTVADGIDVSDPVRGGQVLEAVRRTGGDMLAVDDLEIAAALRDVAGKGFQIEPTAAAGVAGLARYLARGDAAELVVTAFTGSNASALEP
jgi:threonine synthase